MARVECCAQATAMHTMPLTIVDWGSVADWVSGIGSLAAVVVALYVAVFSQRVKLRASCTLASINAEASGEPIDVVCITVTNTSPRPTTVTNIFFSSGIWRWKRYYFVKFMRDKSTNLPALLSDSQIGYWYIPMRQENYWAREFVNKSGMTRFSVATLKVLIITSTGGETVIRPEKAFRDTLMALVKEKKTAKALAE